MHLGSGFGRVLIDIRTPINEDKGHAPLDPAHVAALAASLKEIGLIQPVVIQRRSNIPYLVAGRHRVAAARSLGWKEISAIVLPDRSTSADAGVFAELIEIDENLARRHLSDAEQAHLLGKRKIIYETLHPETVNGAVGNGREKVRQFGEATADRFTAATAKVSGRSERDIQRGVERAKKIGDDIVKLKGTSLDKGVELDALAKLPPADRKPLIEAAARGEKVTARTNVSRKTVAAPTVTSLPSGEPSATQNTLVDALIRQWDELNSTGRAAFFRRIEDTSAIQLEETSSVLSIDQPQNTIFHPFPEGNLSDVTRNPRRAIAREYYAATTSRHRYIANRLATAFEMLVERRLKGLARTGKNLTDAYDGAVADLEPQLRAIERLAAGKRAERA